MFGIKTRIVRNIHNYRWYAIHYKRYLNRDRTIKDYINNNKVKKLNLACWPHIERGWLNTDLYGNEHVIPWDMTKVFPVQDSIFDYIFSEHAIEHFDLEQGVSLLHECYRVLKPDGKIRLATPGLDFLIKLYNENKTPTQKAYIKWAGKEFLKNNKYKNDTIVINNFFRAWEHKIIYDYKTLKLILEDVGFNNVTKYKPGESKDPHFKNMEKHWKSIGRKDFNNLETFAIEGTKLKTKK